MTRPIIEVENVSKRYRLGQFNAHSLREEAERLFRRWRSNRNADGASAPANESEFWALKDVSFSVQPGEVIGIIGRNGAGKSTLLKILSRITEPTSGQIRMRGRVASLLEVGTGFHPELTGRENIFLNGAILGMTRAEIKAKFDEIVAFADIEKFLDTPVKRYSSGMYVRLAFAVAAHLEPEILIVDEVLAVGDAEFQKKCLGKMSDVANQGRTVLFVSHNMHAIERLCQRVLWVERGSLSGIYRDVREGILTYLKGGSKDDHLTAVWRPTVGFAKNNYFLPHELRVSSGDPRAPVGAKFSNRFDIVVDVRGQVFTADPALNVGIGLYTEEGELLFESFTTDEEQEDWIEMVPGAVHLQVVIPPRLLNEGNYRVELLASLHCREWLLEPGRSEAMVSFSIQGGLSSSPYWVHKRSGILAPVLRWRERSRALVGC